MQTFVAGAVALSLHAGGSAKAFECREVRGIQGIFAAFRGDRGSAGVPGVAPIASEGDGVPLWLVEIELRGLEDALNVGLGKHWTHPGRIGQFAGFGATLPGRRSLRRGGQTEPERPPVALGVWVGGGAYWALSDSFRVGIGGKWTPGRVTLSGAGDHAGMAEAVASATLRW